MEERLQNFTTFSQARAKVLEDNLKKEGAAKRSNEARKFAKLLAEYGVPSVKDLDEEKRHAFFNALVAEEELETEGNAFGAAVKKAKEDGEGCSRSSGGAQFSLPRCEFLASRRNNWSFSVHRKDTATLWTQCLNDQIV